MRKDPFNDKEFLKALDKQQYKTLYAKIISLDFDDNPIEEIQGTVTGGSISVNGTSAVRRTCSLSLAASSMMENIHDYYWGLNTKFKLSIGVSNAVNPEYDEIIWFPQGTYVISSFDTSQSAGTHSISLQGNDKMALLNGTVGGVVTSLTHNFGVIDEIDEKGNIVTTDLLLKDIITDAVHTYANEPLHNIIVNDLDDIGVELIEYRGKTPLYMIVDNNTNLVTNMTNNGQQGGYYVAETKEPKTLDSLGDGYDPRIELDMGGTVTAQKPTVLQVKNAEGEYTGNYTIIKVEAGHVVGYRATDLTYAGDLILNVGETITSLLDKIVSMLGEFEYFYNLDGQFVFQRKKTYVQTSFNNLTKDGEGVTYATNAAETSSVSYSFEDSVLISSFSNSPDYAHLRNDFSIWGTRDSVSGKELSVHLRCAVDEKPIKYTSIEVTQEEVDAYEAQWDVISAGPQTSITYTTENISEENVVGNLDWREIIYQMAMDYSRWNHLDGFNAKIASANPWRRYEIINELGKKDWIEEPGYPDGYTGYEQYYIDLQSFWRQLYNPDYEGSYKVTYVTRSNYEKDPTIYNWYQQCKADEEFVVGRKYYIDTVSSGYTHKKRLTKAQYDNYPTNYYYIQHGTIDKHEVEIKISSSDNPTDKFKSDIEYYTKDSDGKITEVTLENEEKFKELLAEKDVYYKEMQLVIPYDPDKKYYLLKENEYNPDTHWSYTVSQNPEMLNFWFDFLDTEGELSKYSVKNIGSRPKAENNNDVKAIYFREIPDILFYGENVTDEELAIQRAMKPGFTFIRLNQVMENLFSISGQGKSAKDVLDNMLYNYTYCTEEISLSTIPIYYLQPNTRIFVRDDKSGINGEYIMESFTVPLGQGGAMSISAVKAVENMY